MEYLIAFAAGLAVMIALPALGRRRRDHAERPTPGQHRGPVAIWVLGCVLTGLLAVLARASFG